MSVKKFIKRKISILRHADFVTRRIDYENRKQAQVLKKYGYPNGFPTVDLFELLPAFDEKIEPYSFLDGVASPIDIAILKGLAREIKDCQYLEIGALRGESIANVASVARECVSLSLPPNEMRQFGYSEDLINSHGLFLKDLVNVSQLCHNSQTFDFISLKKKFDLIFIDGDHYDESVRMDTINAFRVLRNENSMIVWHDYGFTPGNIRWSVFAGILAGTPPEKRKRIYHISNSLCAIYVNRDFQSLSTSQPEIPDKLFSVTISCKKGLLPNGNVSKN